jgi:predicted NACHT family NTPase
VRGGQSGQFECTTLNSLTRIGDFVMITGDPGSGKSTLLKWAAVEAARSFSRADDSNQPKIPFLIKLRSLPDSLPSLNEIGAPMTDGLVVERPDNWSGDLIESGRAILLFDGLDEVPEERRESIVGWIQQIHQDFGRRGTRIMVTSRPAAVRDWRFRLNGAVQATIIPMPHGKIERFVRLWHHSVYAAQELPASGDWKAKSDQLLAQLEGDRQLSQLAANPLLGAVICALYHARSEHLPSERPELYESLLAMLLARRDHERRGIDKPLSLTDTERLIEDVALAFLGSERDEVPRSEVLDVLRQSLSGFRNHDVRDIGLENCSITSSDGRESSGNCRPMG